MLKIHQSHSLHQIRDKFSRPVNKPKGVERGKVYQEGSDERFQRMRSTLGITIVAIASLLSLPSRCWGEEEHKHAEHGPHGGPLVELGDEEYHAEVLLDEKANVVTVHVLDGEAKDAVAIESKEIIINVRHGKKPKQYRLSSFTSKAPGSSESKEAKSSRFTLKSADLIEDLHHEDRPALLRLSISGKNYSGKIDLAHDHDHK